MFCRNFHNIFSFHLNCNNSASLIFSQDCKAYVLCMCKIKKQLRFYSYLLHFQVDPEGLEPPAL